MTRLLQYWIVDGTRFDQMPENYAKARRMTHLERSELELTAIARHALLNTDFSLMLYDVGVVYGGLMIKASGLDAWEDVGVLLVDTLFSDYWWSQPTYDDEWVAYEEAACKVVSVPDRVVDLIKAATSTIPAPMPSSEVYKSFESVGYAASAIYDHVHGLCCGTDEIIFAGFLVILCHGICDYARDCYEENYSNCCMILHGLDEDGFSLGCAVLFAVWNSLDGFSNGPSRLYQHMISTSMSGNLSIPRYCAKEQLVNCTTMGERSMGLKRNAIEIVKHMTGVSIS
ncbi:hypothetical protein BGZ67_007898 [Mortierella alpina]|nr:hypothetical protein BGZ67_007898 [Mortierella alpina]